MHRVGEDGRAERSGAGARALARASGTLGSAATPTPGTGRIPTRSTRRSRRSSRSVGRAGPRSTRSADLIGRERHEDLLREPGRSTRTSRVPVGGGCPQPAARTPARSGRRPPGGLSDALESSPELVSARRQDFSRLSEKRVTKAVRAQLREYFPRVKVSCAASSVGAMWTGECRTEDLPCRDRVVRD